MPHIQTRPSIILGKEQCLDEKINKAQKSPNTGTKVVSTNIDGLESTIEDNFNS